MLDEIICGNGLFRHLRGTSYWRARCASTRWCKQSLHELPRIAIEAAGKLGWARYVGSEDNVIGLSGFGASAPAERLYEEFGITTEEIARKAKSLAG